MLSVQSLSVVMAFAGLLSLSGCSDDGLAKRYPVSGKVTYKGQPLEKGMVSFIPDAPDGRSATGTIENGAFTMTTQETNDGVFPGKYSVTIASRTPDLVSAAAKAKAKKSTSAFIPQDFVAEANRNAKNTLPEKYSVPATTPLKGVEVKAESNTFTWDLVD
jgi:hypothetical protein